MLYLHQPVPSLIPTSPFTFKHILENSNHFLVELKEVKKDFNWIKISKDKKDIHKLIMNYKDSSYNIEEIFFEEGYLKFTLNDGVFIEKFNSQQHNYQIRNIDFGYSLIATLNEFFVS